MSTPAIETQCTRQFLIPLGGEIVYCRFKDFLLGGKFGAGLQSLYGSKSAKMGVR